MATAFLIDFWRSIPPRDPNRYDTYGVYPHNCYYTTITGWRVRVFDAWVRGPQNLTTRQKAFWNGLAILFLPFSIMTWIGHFLIFLIYDIPAYGIYMVWTEALAFPYFRSEWDRWRNESIVIRQVRRDSKRDHVLHFALDGQDYSFADFNSIFREDEKDIFFRVLVLKEHSPIQVQVARNNQWEKFCHQAQFSWIRSPLKLLLGICWLRFVWVLVMNSFFAVAKITKMYAIIVKEHGWLVPVTVSIGWSTLLEMTWIHWGLFVQCFYMPNSNSVFFRSWNPEYILSSYAAQPTIPTTSRNKFR